MHELRVTIEKFNILEQKHMKLSQGGSGGSAYGFKNLDGENFKFNTNGGNSNHNYSSSLNSEKFN